MGFDLRKAMEAVSRNTGSTSGFYFFWNILKNDSGILIGWERSLIAVNIRRKIINRRNPILTTPTSSPAQETHRSHLSPSVHRRKCRSPCDISSESPPKSHQQHSTNPRSIVGYKRFAYHLMVLSAFLPSLQQEEQTHVHSPRSIEIVRVRSYHQAFPRIATRKFHCFEVNGRIRFR